MGESINEGGEARYDAVYDYFPILEERHDQKAGTIERMSDDMGATVLFVEQNLSVIDSLADRCYVMEKGRIVEEVTSVERETVASHLAV